MFTRILNLQHFHFSFISFLCVFFLNFIKHWLYIKVEQLEHQMRDMTKLMDENEAKTKEIEAERQEAIDKIFVLRDIIRDLEGQVETKNESEAELKAVIAELEEVIKQQIKTVEELNRQVEDVRSGAELQHLKDHIRQLEDELQRRRLSSEYIGSDGALKQIKTQASRKNLYNL